MINPVNICKECRGPASFTKRLLAPLAVTLIAVTPYILAANPMVTADFSVNNGVGHPLVFGESKQDTNTASFNSQHAAGITLVRRVLFIQNIVPANTTVANYKANVNNVADPTTWDWSTWDGYGALYHNQGFKIIAETDYMPGWLSYANGDSHGLPTDWGVWQDIVKKVYAHIKGQVDYMEIWNEPNGGFLNTSGSPYTDNLTAYKDLYYYSSAAIRTLDATVPIGGPALSYAESSWVTSLLADSRCAPNVNFLSYHSYNHGTNNEDQNDLSSMSNAAASGGKAGIPIFTDEWNWTAAYTNDPMTGGSPLAVSFVGRRLTNLIYNHAFGSILYSEPPGSSFPFLNADETLMPKGRTYQLLSKDLELGAGNSTLAGVTSVSSIAAAGAATNAKGHRVVWLVNDSTTVSAAVDLTIKGLSSSSATATVYLASSQYANNDASGPVSSQTVAITGGQFTLTNLNLPGYSVLGVILTPSGYALPTKYEVENLAEANTGGVTYALQSDPGASNGQWGKLNSSATGQYVSYTIGNLTAGTVYGITVGVKTTTTRGVFQMYVDGVATSQTYDEYATGNGSFTSVALGTYTPSTSGNHTFQFTVVGKNASSSSYGLGFDYISLAPQ